MRLRERETHAQTRTRTHTSVPYTRSRETYARVVTTPTHTQAGARIAHADTLGTHGYAHGAHATAEKRTKQTHAGRLRPHTGAGGDRTLRKVLRYTPLPTPKKKNMAETGNALIWGWDGGRDGGEGRGEKESERARVLGGG